MAFERPITVKEAVENIHAKEYLLPAIQREVVWDVDQITKLFDSLMRDYPIGSFLFWYVDRKNSGKYVSFMNLCGTSINSRIATTQRPTSVAKMTSSPSS